MSFFSFSTDLPPPRGPVQDGRPAEPHGVRNHGNLFKTRCLQAPAGGGQQQIPAHAGATEPRPGRCHVCTQGGIKQEILLLLICINILNTIFFFFLIIAKMEIVKCIFLMVWLFV